MAFLGGLPCLQAGEPFAIDVREKATDMPVSLVELRTTGQLRFVSDNAGRIAIDTPELMDREVWFEVIGHGYTVPKDGFGFRGVKLTPKPGGQIKVIVERTMIAQRLGRLTGSGLFAESQKLGLEVNFPESGIVGQDTVQTSIYRGKRFWLWGDTTLADYPLGIFDATAATTDLKFLDALQPPLKPNFRYFRDANKRPRSVAKMPGVGPTWVFGVTSLQDAGGVEKLVGCYCKIRNHLEAYEWGLCVWNDQTEQFDPLRTIWTKSDKTPNAPLVPNGHASRWKDAAGQEWLLFGEPFPHLRMPATYEAWQDPTLWKSLEAPKQLGSIKVHHGSIGYHEWRKKWVAVFTQKDGKSSSLGEVWFTESESPFGPWREPIQVLTHDNYTFYNPKVHVDMLGKDSPILFFEGTYTAEFANHAAPTPRYNYNQILYRVDLSDKRFK
jgi:hypothetical protein